MSTRVQVMIHKFYFERKNQNDEILLFIVCRICKNTLNVVKLREAFIPCKMIMQ